MQVTNIHKRIISQPKEKVSALLKTLATPNDLIWPCENWPAMRFKDGLKIGSKGGHGPIRYTIIDLKEGEYVKFQFSKPDGFNGTHQLKINEKSKRETELVHEIRMNTSFKATLLWLVAVRWLHNALIEEAFDKVENHFMKHKKETSYSLWFKFLREAFKRKPVQTRKV